MRGLILVAGMLTAAPRLLGCECEAPTLKDAKKNAEVVFRGIITGVSAGWIHFRVERVWKGTISRNFAMIDFRESSACLGFWPMHVQRGNDLLVFAKWLPPGDQAGEFFTDICTRTGLAADRADDIRKLGEGWKPRNR